MSEIAKHLSEIETERGIRLEHAVYLSVNGINNKILSETDYIKNVVARNSALRAFIDVSLGRRVILLKENSDVLSQIKFMAQEYGVNFSSWVIPCKSEVINGSMFLQRSVKNKYGEVESKNSNITTDYEINEIDEIYEKYIDFAVFIGGSQNHVDEYIKFHKKYPKVTVIPVMSTGGATTKIADILGVDSNVFNVRGQYLSFFHKHLDISNTEYRYITPRHQKYYDIFRKEPVNDFSNRIGMYIYDNINSNATSAQNTLPKIFPDVMCKLKSELLNTIVNMDSNVKYFTIEDLKKYAKLVRSENSLFFIDNFSDFSHGSIRSAVDGNILQSHNENSKVQDYAHTSPFVHTGFDKLAA